MTAVKTTTKVFQENQKSLLVQRVSFEASRITAEPDGGKRTSGKMGNKFTSAVSTAKNRRRLLTILQRLNVEEFLRLRILIDRIILENSRVCSR